MRYAVTSGVQPAEEFALVSGSRPATGDDRSALWLEATFHEHYGRMVGVLARMVGDRAQAEEIAADVFYKLAHRRAQVNSPADLVAWLYRVAMNAGLDALRSNSRRRKREREAGAESLRTAAQGGALEEILARERRARVQAVLATLKPRDTQLLMLRAAGLAYREVAETMGINPGSVGTLLARAEAEFEKKFRARYGDDL
jgi:RNA polymerase sigma-70 factor, ECF subfamily